MSTLTNFETWHLDNKEIQVIFGSFPQSDLLFNEFYSWIDAASLYGILRSFPIRKLKIEENVPYHILIEFSYPYTYNECFKMSFYEFCSLNEQYCKNLRQTNWLKEGF